MWTWIKARIQSANFDDIYIGDYIPFVADGNNVKAEIARIDTYYNYGDSATGHHIDFISRDCWTVPHVYNKVNYNNGTTVSLSPWLTCDLYAYLNSLQMNVPNASTENPALVRVDYRTTGVYDKLPIALKNIIVSKRVLLPQRYTEGALLSNDNSVNWANTGMLWLPSEMEIFGYEYWGSKNGYSSAGFQQYPLFTNNMRRVKSAGDGGIRCTWWLLSAVGNTSNQCVTIYRGHSNYTLTATSSIYVPLCFRIA